MSQLSFIDLSDLRKAKEETPLMKQYHSIKAKYPHSVVLFRVGDFYETFGSDAVIASKVLGITLTKRNNGSASEIELAGFPHHSLEIYLPKLVRNGHRVAVCDQLEDPKQAKGIVKRGVTELVTPGLVLNDAVLSQKRSNYLGSIYTQGNDLYGISLLDISTGEFLATQCTQHSLEHILHNYHPTEIICSKTQRKNIELLEDMPNSIFGIDEWVYSLDYAQEKLNTLFGTSTLKGFGIDPYPLGVIAAGATMHYLEITEHKDLQHIRKISRIDENSFVWLDKFTIKNLELVESNNEGNTTLIEVLDHTNTPMGSRLLRNWLLHPLKDIVQINQRLESVACILEGEELCQNLSNLLEPVGDLERLLAKIATNRASPRDVLQLGFALTQLEKLLEVDAPPYIKNLYIQKIEACKELKHNILNTIVEDAPMFVHQGGVIRQGVSEELDKLRSISIHGKEKIVQIAQKEAMLTGIGNLKIQYNKVFGYYIEVTNSHKQKVPSNWIRKQTTTHAERYITEEIKELENQILNSQEKIQQIEHELFQKLLLKCKEYILTLQKNCLILSELDCLLSYAKSAIANRYHKPDVRTGYALEIVEGRHPVIEKKMKLGEAYIPNSVKINEDQQILIITGPNMSGKSAILRQTALIVLMAQCGSYVPAQSAQIGIVDKIFTRVGASDNLSKGESTFMVEMLETAQILNNATQQSLIIMDEIGRGTSTYDGISIAWSIVNYLHNAGSQPKTLFATHYHELNELEKSLSRVKNYAVSVKEYSDKILFLRKLVVGGSEHSFGIHVAKIAGMPYEIIKSAEEKLKELENNRQVKGNVKKQTNKSIDEDPNWALIKKELASLDPEKTTPLEALQILTNLKRWAAS